MDGCSRAYRCGGLIMPGYAATPIAERLRRSIRINAKTSCWEWQKHVGAWGYPQIGIGSRKDGSRRIVYAHRLSYETFVASIPAEYQVDHLCRNKCCINPLHLEAVTEAENIRRAGGGNVFGAKQRAKTLCPKGHEYSGRNLLLKKGGKRQCRACTVVSTRAWRARRKSP